MVHAPRMLRSGRLLESRLNLQMLHVIGNGMGKKATLEDWGGLEVGWVGAPSIPDVMIIPKVDLKHTDQCSLWLNKGSHSE